MFGIDIYVLYFLIWFVYDFYFLDKYLYIELYWGWGKDIILIISNNMIIWYLNWYI